MFWDNNANCQKPFCILHAVNLKDASATRESSRWTEEWVGVILLAVYFLFECRTSLWKFRHRIWSKIILESLWIGNNVINTVNKRFYGLTFRLVLVKHWLRNLLHGNVCFLQTL